MFFEKFGFNKKYVKLKEAENERKKEHINF